MLLPMIIFSTLLPNIDTELTSQLTYLDMRKAELAIETCSSNSECGQTTHSRGCPLGTLRCRLWYLPPSHRETTLGGVGPCFFYNGTWFKLHCSDSTECASWKRKDTYREMENRL